MKRVGIILCAGDLVGIGLITFAVLQIGWPPLSAEDGSGLMLQIGYGWVLGGMIGRALAMMGDK